LVEGEMRQIWGAMTAGHVPVLTTPVLQHLKPQPQAVIVDVTIGTGGLGLLIARAMQFEGVFVAIDRDPEMIEIARRRFAEEGVPESFVKWIVGSYADLTEHLAGLGIKQCGGVVMDLGLNSYQIADPSRGFSLMADDGPLDMRYCRSENIPTLAERLSRMTERELEDVLRQSDERYARRIARAIIRRCDQGRLRTTGDLAAAIRSAIARARPGRWGRIDPATRSFQALRVMVNDEMGHLSRGLEQAVEALAPGGRIVVISFHSGEDRLVKQTFRKHEGSRLEILTRKPVRPDREECQRNPRARSSRTRAAMRI